jgi:hypothetical protein
MPNCLHCPLIYTQGALPQIKGTIERRHGKKAEIIRVP